MAAEDPAEKKYEVREQVGKGAFGTVSLVVDKDTKKTYVLKKIRLARQTEWQRRTTLQEMKLVAALEHPFVVPHIESWIHATHTVKIVYGYCEQGDLSNYVRRLKRKNDLISEEQLMLWCAEMLLALQYIHRKKVLHRDIKTSNIFLTSTGDVQLGDFGLATFRGTSEQHHQDQSVVGTPHFMSPEIVSMKEYSFKSDIWSLGCVMYELTALRPPFDAFNIRGLVDKICRFQAPPLPAEYSDNWKNIVRKMMRKDQDKRPSAAQLLQLPELQSSIQEALKKGAAISAGFRMPVFSADEQPPSPMPAAPDEEDAEEEQGAAADEYAMSPIRPLRGITSPTAAGGAVSPTSPITHLQLQQPTADSSGMVSDLWSRQESSNGHAAAPDLLFGGDSSIGTTGAGNGTTPELFLGRSSGMLQGEAEEATPELFGAAAGKRSRRSSAAGGSDPGLVRPSIASDTASVAESPAKQGIVGNGRASPGMSAALAASKVAQLIRQQQEAAAQERAQSAAAAPGAASKPPKHLQQPRRLVKVPAGGGAAGAGAEQQQAGAQRATAGTKRSVKDVPSRYLSSMPSGKRPASRQGSQELHQAKHPAPQQQDSDLERSAPPSPTASKRSSSTAPLPKRLGAIATVRASANGLGKSQKVSTPKAGTVAARMQRKKPHAAARRSKDAPSSSLFAPDAATDSPMASNPPAAAFVFSSMPHVAAAGKHDGASSTAVPEPNTILKSPSGPSRRSSQAGSKAAHLEGTASVAALAAAKLAPRSHTARVAATATAMYASPAKQPQKVNSARSPHASRQVSARSSDGAAAAPAATRSPAAKSRAAGALAGRSSPSPASAEAQPQQLQQRSRPGSANSVRSSSSGPVASYVGSLIQQLNKAQQPQVELAASPAQHKLRSSPAPIAVGRHSPVPKIVPSSAAAADAAADFKLLAVPVAEAYVVHDNALHSSSPAAPAAATDSPMLQAVSGSRVRGAKMADTARSFAFDHTSTPSSPQATPRSPGLATLAAAQQQHAANGIPPPLESQPSSTTEDEQHAANHAHARHSTTDQLKRLRYLERCVALMGKLYARQSWQALGQVMASPALLPSTELQSGVLRSMFCAPPDGMPRPLGSPIIPPLPNPYASHAAAATPTIASPLTTPRSAPPTSPSAYSSASDTADSPTPTATTPSTPPGLPAFQHQMKVGDRIFLGTRKRLRGVIRYVGPVHWDAADWVGIELESPAGTCNGTIEGIAYFAAPDKFGIFVAACSMVPQPVPGSIAHSPRLLVPTPGHHPSGRAA